MIDQVKNLVETDKDYSAVLKSIYENPYSEAKDIGEKTNITDTTKVEGIIKDLTNKFIIIELSSQASSNIESRVPKKIFLVNPDIENDLEELL